MDKTSPARNQNDLSSQYPFVKIPSIEAIDALPRVTELYPISKFNSNGEIVPSDDISVAQYGSALAGALSLIIPTPETERGYIAMRGALEHFAVTLEMIVLNTPCSLLAQNILMERLVNTTLDFLDSDLKIAFNDLDVEFEVAEETNVKTREGIK